MFDVLTCSALPNTPKMNEMKSPCFIKANQANLTISDFRKRNDCIIRA